jgi:ribosomal protein S18 acetylase RimI-like enzyme
MGHRSFTLECTPATFQPRASRTAGFKVVFVKRRNVAQCKRLWSRVGAGFWTERVRWDQARWHKHLRQPNVSFWIALVSGQEAGCFELTESTRGVKIEGFGLLPQYRGEGLGRDLLTAATERAFATGAPKVWLRTATDDHPNALPNYLSGGYRVVGERELARPLRAQGMRKLEEARGGGA